MFGYRARIGYITPSVFELNAYDFYRIVPDGVGLVGVACMVEGWKEEAYKKALAQVESCAQELSRRFCDFVIHGGAPLVLSQGKGFETSFIEKLQAILWDEQGRRTPNTIAISPQRIAALAGFEVPADRTFLIVEQQNIGQEQVFSSEKLCPVLATYRYKGFEDALKMVEQIFAVGGKGHSCGIYSFDEDHIDRLAAMAPVSRIMVRQPQAVGNAGSFTNGMPMTASLGCGTWGGNSTSENIHLKHYMNVTWVSRPIAEDRPSEQELFGEFYGTPVS